MTPVVPVFPEWPSAPVTVFAKDQPEYLQLPAYKASDGMVISRWRLTLMERLKILFGGNIWLAVLTFNCPLQPVKMFTDSSSILE